MCDILAISAGHNYTPGQYLPIFAAKGRKNLYGWGIGFYRDDRALVEKSADQAFDGEQVHESFQRLARIIDSRIIVSHLRCHRGGGRHVALNHPFCLPFLNHSWLFVHVGIVEHIEQYCTEREPRLDTEVYPARVFEFLRDKMMSHLEMNPYLSLYDVVQRSIAKLVAAYPGYYNFFLANESVLFAYCNHGQLLLLKESETPGEVLLLTSLDKGLSEKEWLPIRAPESSIGRLLVIAGPEVLYMGDL
ncbi:MAG: class II glutamine amidotransferase [Deltaproteobacteria bacterium]|nr:class II glutamine amidotransferase [Deltaproteobacteria bacterium]